MCMYQHILRAANICMRMIERLIVYLHVLRGGRAFACVNWYQRVGVFALCWPVSGAECIPAYIVAGLICAHACIHQ